jgi:hypothetical protein
MINEESFGRNVEEKICDLIWGLLSHLSGGPENNDEMSRSGMFPSFPIFKPGASEYK